MATKEELIQEYLSIRDNINLTVNAVLDKSVSIDTIPEGEEKDMIKLTVETVERKKKHMHLKQLYATAIIEYKTIHHSNMKMIQKIAAKYELSPEIFAKEIYKHTNQSDYVFTTNIEEEYISYVQEDKIWQYLELLIKEKNIPCSCRVCFLLESSLHAYEFIKQWKLLDYFYEQWKLHKAATIEWIRKFEMRYRDEIDNLCSKFCNKNISMTIKEQIQEYLFIRDNINIRVNAVLNKSISIDTIPEGEEKNMIKLTVEIVNKKKEHMHEKALYEAAINDYKVTEHSNIKAISKVAAKYGLQPILFSQEVFQYTTDLDYVFTKDIEDDYTNISYAEEEKLWQDLELLVKGKVIPCSCRVCFLLESSIHAYKYRKEWQMSYSYQKWATIIWLKKFEMRHRDEIDNLCSKFCNKSTCSVAPVESVCSTSKSNK